MEDDYWPKDMKYSVVIGFTAITQPRIDTLLMRHGAVRINVQGAWHSVAVPAAHVIDLVTDLALPDIATDIHGRDRYVGKVDLMDHLKLHGLAP